jgi:hypothetical protein
MKSRYHILTALPFLLMYVNDPILYLSLFTGAVLIDFDHCFDFFLRYRRPTFSITELSGKLARDKFIIPLHSMEFSLVVLVCYFLTRNDIVLAFARGYFVHMFFDVNTNGYPSLASMSVIYRAVKWGRDVCSNTD